MSTESGRRWALIAGGCVLAAMTLAATPASAASHPGATGSWQDYTVPLAGGTLGGIYASSAGNAWAAGSGPATGSSSSTGYAHFNGTTWQSASGPQIGAASVISGSSASDVWVIGATSTAHYDGTQWTTYDPYLPAGATNYTQHLGAEVFSAGPGDAWAEIPVSIGGAVFETLLEHFDGTAWSLASVPGVSEKSDIGEITGTGPDDVYVVTYDSSDYPQLLHFNGSGWSVEQPSGQQGGTPDVSLTGPGSGLATWLTGFTPGAAELTDGTWKPTSLPVSDYYANEQTSGTGRAWVDLLPTSGLTTGDGTMVLWQWSAGSWQQLTVNPYSYLSGDADGSGVWSYQHGGDGSVAFYAAS